MENYIVSARKYRPTTFETVVGQEALTTTLKNAITSGKLAHAYLFCGPRGVGKTTCARIFAKTINCTNLQANGEACGVCDSCRSFAEGRSLNVYELDAASNNSVEDIRSLCDQVQVLPQLGRYKVFIIDEVHMLSTSAFNAFLKTLEEPPSHAIFILATTEKHKILPTILSRCQIYDFNRMEVPDVVNHLKGVAEKEGIAYEEEALNVIARKSDGGMRDALSIFDQVASYSNGNITYQKVIEDLNILDYDYYFSLVDKFLAKDIPGVMLTLNEVLAKGFDAGMFISGLGSHLRDLLMSTDRSTLHLVEVADSQRKRYAEQASHCKPKFLYRAIRICTDCEQSYRTSRNKRLLVEISLIELAQAADDEYAGPRPDRILKPIFTGEVKAASSAPQTIASVNTPTTKSSASSGTVSAEKNIVNTPGAQPRPYEQAKNNSPEVRQPRVSEPQQVASYNRSATRISIKQATTAPAGIEREAHKPLEASPQVEEKTIAKELRTNDFSNEDLSYNWLRYALNLPKEQNALASRLKNMLVKRGEGFAVNVGVENEQVAEQFLSIKDDLLAYLCSHLGNDAITFNVSVVQTEAPKSALSRRDQHNEMLKNSYPFALLCKELQLELT